MNEISDGLPVTSTAINTFILHWAIHYISLHIYTYSPNQNILKWKLHFTLISTLSYNKVLYEERFFRTSCTVEFIKFILWELFLISRHQL
jgi:hypothetical protein